MKPATLLLEDGTSFTGKHFGADHSVSGEVVFNTGMMGYPESMTDPSYEGQIITFTYPLIGNYGIPEKGKNPITSHFESSTIHSTGIIVSEYSEKYSHWTAKKSLGQWMKEHGTPGITGIDTRALTQHLRTKGAMLGKIIIDKKTPGEFYDPNTENLVAQVSTKKVQTYKTHIKNLGRKKTKTVVLIDCGVKNNSIRCFLERGVNVILVPWNYDIFQHKLQFDGIFLPNGPGDPAMLTEIHAITKTALEKKTPIFGICLGCQILAIAAGGKTYKLKFGHRAQNQPCMDLETKRCYITSQNHGYAVDGKTLPKQWKVWFENINDQTVEGIKHTSLPFFAVQFHPEAVPGPGDTEFLFDEFIKQL